MFCSVKELRNCKIHAIDGDIGKVSQFLFDDKTWKVRYLVIDTSSWLIGRKVLISPQNISKTGLEDKILPVDLTKEKIKNSPGLEEHQPVSRQYEQAIHNYYGWSPYWMGGEGALIAPVSPPAGEDFKVRPKGEPNLQSTREITGYKIQAKDGEIGHVEDFLIDSDGWIVRYIRIDTRKWLPGKDVLLAAEWIGSIDWIESQIHIDIPKEKIENAPEYDPDRELDRGFEEKIYQHYGREGYWQSH